MTTTKTGAAKKAIEITSEATTEAGADQQLDALRAHEGFVWGTWGLADGRYEVVGWLRADGIDATSPLPKGMRFVDLDADGVEITAEVAT